MSDFFEEYAWLVQSVVGGSIGIEILFHCIIERNSLFTDLLITIMEGLM